MNGCNDLMGRVYTIYAACRKCDKRTNRIEDWMACSSKCVLMKELNALENRLDISSARSYDALGLGVLLDIDAWVREQEVKDRAKAREVMA